MGAQFNPMTARAMTRSPSVYMGARAINQARYASEQGARGAMQDLEQAEQLNKSRATGLKRAATSAPGPKV